MSKPKTPLRYPGGKQKLAPFISEVIEVNDLLGCEYAEPFAGGAGVACELLLSKKVSRIHLNDVSYPIYCFWKAIFDDTERFCRRISSVTLSVDTWKRQRRIFQNPDQHDTFEVGFSTFYLSRCNRSGILHGGLIGGLKQDGEWLMDARFHRKHLIERIQALAKMKKEIRLRNWDAERFILEYVNNLPTDTLTYCDPPYYHKADRLYPNYYKPDDHARIAGVIKKRLKTKWLVSYDDAAQIELLYSGVPKLRYTLRYNASTSYEGTEVFFFSNRLIVPTSSSFKPINLALSSSSLQM
jgi:DNA adenine methylase